MQTTHILIIIYRAWKRIVKLIFMNKSTFNFHFFMTVCGRKKFIIRSLFMSTVMSHGSHGVSNHRQLQGFFNSFFSSMIDETSKLNFTTPSWGNLVKTGEFSSQSQWCGKISMTWRHKYFNRHVWIRARLWWRHRMETCSALLALCAENSPVTGEFPNGKASDAKLWGFLWSAPWINGRVNNGETGDMIRHRAHYDVSVMLLTRWVILESMWNHVNILFC